MTKPKYPTWKIKGSPTPNEKLVICDQCGLAQWVIQPSVECCARRFAYAAALEACKPAHRTKQSESRSAWRFGFEGGKDWECLASLW